MGAAGNQSGDVGHVHQQKGAHLVGDGAETGKIQYPGICAATGDDELGPVLTGQSPHFVVVNGLSFPVHSVGYEFIKLA